jgi:hypothetical protein
MSTHQKLDMNWLRKLIINSFLILLLNQFSYSQYLTNRRVDWSLLEIMVNDSVKLEYLKRTVESEYDNISYLFSASRFTSHFDYENYLKEELKNYHFIDINHDKLLDIVHEGRVNELEDIVFYVNMGDSLRIGLKLLGYAETITFQNNKLVSIQTIMPPCCCGFSHYRVYYSFKKPSHRYSQMIKNSDPSYSEYYSELLNCRLLACEALGYYILPQKVNLTEEFVSHQSFYLTTNPKPIFNETYPGEVDCTYGILDKSNQIAYFETNSKGIILSNYTSKDGSTYSFIKIKNNISKHSIINIRDCYVYGWTLTNKIK